MNINSSSSSSSGIGFFGLLTIALIVLKLLKVITWSWWLVFIPIWGTLALFVIIGGLIWGILLLVSRHEAKIRANKYKK
jgi:protein-S-isoprenylcysteine O-methyltransferase Ste14